MRTPKITQEKAAFTGFLALFAFWLVFAGYAGIAPASPVVAQLKKKGFI